MRYRDTATREASLNQLGSVWGYATKRKLDDRTKPKATIQKNESLPMIDIKAANSSTDRDVEDLKALRYAKVPLLSDPMK